MSISDGVGALVVAAELHSNAQRAAVLPPVKFALCAAHEVDGGVIVDDEHRRVLGSESAAPVGEARCTKKFFSISFRNLIVYDGNFNRFLGFTRGKGENSA